ncbi:MAG: O-antigen ligase family protein [Pseudomonadota bacterium]
MFGIFIFLIVFSPLAFGTVAPWSYAIMEILSFLVLSICLIRGGKNKEALSAVPGITPLIFFLLYIIIQLVPFPQALIKVLSPHAHLIHLNSEMLSGPRSWMTLSIHPGATLAEFFRWATYVGFYVLTVQLLRNRELLRKTVVAITIFGALLSFSSILQFYLTTDRALWFWHVPKNSMIVGPYICHNHYAGLMEMIFPVILALFFFHRPRVRNSSLIKGIVEILSQEKANIHILIGAAALLTVTSVFVSLSRGGMLSLCLSLVLFTYLLFKKMISRGNAILIIALVVLAALSIGWFGWDQIFERFEKLKNAQGVIHESRLDFWKDSVNIIKDFPLTGSGIGTFIDIYRSYQTVSGILLISHAHNDYIQLAVEGGIIGFLLAGSFIVTLFYKTYNVFLARKDAYSVYLYMGSLTGLFSILIHSVTDFNFHIGANGLWFFFLAGLAVSAANTGMRTGSRITLLAPVQSPPVKKAAVVTVSIMMVGVLCYHVLILTSKFYFSHIRYYVMDAKSPVEDLQNIKKISGYASRLDPLNGEYPFARANAAVFLKDDDAAITDFERAVYLNPAYGFYLKKVGGFFANKGDNELAGKFLAASVSTDISSAENAFGYGAWLLSQHNISQGVDYLKKAVELKTKLIDSALTTMAIHDVSDEDMQRAVPQLPGPAIAYADFLYNSGKKEAAETQYLLALGYIEKQEKISKWQIERIFKFFIKRGNTKEALNVMNRAATAFPFDAGIRINLGDLYKDMGIAYRAREEYEQALFLDPNNKNAKKRLESLKEINP